MENQIPKTAQGILVSKDFKTSLAEYNVPSLTPTSVLIKIHSAPINPSDIFFTMGLYQTGKRYPAIAGFEGSGLVVGAGSDPSSQKLLNKKVAFFATQPSSIGSWAEYTVVRNNFAIPLPPNLDYETGATSFTNPLTVEGFMVLCEEKGYKSIVHSAAASTLGKMLVTACKRNGITLVNIVRRQGQVDLLKELGAEHIINTGEKSWKRAAKRLFKELNVQAFFDALGGSMGGKIIGLMPNNTTTYNYGNMTYKLLEINPGDFIFKQKTVTGYWLPIAMSDPKLRMKLYTRAWEALSKGVYKSYISGKFGLDRFEEALQFYEKNSSKGKVLLQNRNF